MGMFDKPEYLTGPTGYVSVGDKFWLHKARMDGQVNVNGRQADQVKLEVSRERDGERKIVFSSGAGITAQIRRMDSTDTANMPMELRLDEVPSKHGNPTHVLTPAGMPAPSQVADEDIPF